MKTCHSANYLTQKVFSVLFPGSFSSQVIGAPNSDEEVDFAEVDAHCLDLDAAFTPSCAEADGEESGASHLDLGDDTSIAACEEISGELDQKEAEES